MMADKRVREAMSIAINHAAVVKGFMLGNAEPALTYVNSKTGDFMWPPPTSSRSPWSTPRTAR